MAFIGLNHPLCRSGTTFQHFSSGTLHEEKLVEKIAESVPERSYLTHLHQMQGAGGFGGFLKNALSLPSPNLVTPAGFSEASQRMPVAGSTEQEETASLTIFYGGNVNVFNDITAERAQGILFLANTGNSKAIFSAQGGNASAMDFATMTSPRIQSPTAVSKAIPTIASLHNITTINAPIQSPGNTSFNTETGQTSPHQIGLRSANMQLDSVHPGVPIYPPSQQQPVVPTALPQARKASLTRFLEKRRERVLSHSPYPLKQVDLPMPEERCSSSDDIASYLPHNTADERKKVPLPSWMERPNE